MTGSTKSTLRLWLIAALWLFTALGAANAAGSDDPQSPVHELQQYAQYAGGNDTGFGLPFAHESFGEGNIQGSNKSPNQTAGLFTSTPTAFAHTANSGGGAGSGVSVPMGCNMGTCVGGCGAACLLGIPGACIGQCKGLCKGQCDGVTCIKQKAPPDNPPGSGLSDPSGVGVSIVNNQPPSEWAPIGPAVYEHWQSFAESAMGKRGAKQLNTGPARSKLMDNAGEVSVKMGSARHGVRQQNMPGQSMGSSKSNQNAGKNQAADNCALVERYHALAAIDFIRSYLDNFTTNGGNEWNQVRDRLFLPMAFLLLLPGAVITQMRATIVGGIPIVNMGLTEITPFEGIYRSLIAVFLIPSTYLVVNYGIDVANSMTYEIANSYELMFGKNMYDEAYCGHIRAFPAREPQENPGIIQKQHSNMFNYFGSTPLARLEGETFAVKYDDPCKNIYIVPPDRANDLVPYYVNEERLGINQANAAMTIAWTILCALQQAYLYYLWFVGPIMAALWVYPAGQLRQCFMLWLEGVVSVCMWSLFWSIGILIMAMVHNIDGMYDTGTMIFTALNILTIGSTKFAFDISSMCKDVARDAMNIGMKMASAVAQGSPKAASGGGGGGGGGGHGGGGGGGGGIEHEPQKQRKGGWQPPGVAPTPGSKSPILPNDKGQVPLQPFLGANAGDGPKGPVVTSSNDQPITSSQLSARAPEAMPVVAPTDTKLPPKSSSEIRVADNAPGDAGMLGAIAPKIAAGDSNWINAMRLPGESDGDVQARFKTSDAGGSGGAGGAGAVGASIIGAGALAAGGAVGGPPSASGGGVDKGANEGPTWTYSAGCPAWTARTGAQAAACR